MQLKNSAIVKPGQLWTSGGFGRNERLQLLFLKIYSRKGKELNMLEKDRNDKRLAPCSLLIWARGGWGVPRPDGTHGPSTSGSSWVWTWSWHDVLTTSTSYKQHLLCSHNSTQGKWCSGADSGTMSCLFWIIHRREHLFLIRTTHSGNVDYPEDQSLTSPNVISLFLQSRLFFFYYRPRKTLEEKKVFTSDRDFIKLDFLNLL